MVRINFGDVEDSAQLPAGKYHVAVTDVELREVEEGKNAGGEWWSGELTVQDGERQGRKEWLFIGLPPVFDAATLKRLLKASVGQHKWTEDEIESGELEVEMDDILNLEFIATVKPQKKNPDFNNVRISPYDPDEWDSDENLLP